MSDQVRDHAVQRAIDAYGAPDHLSISRQLRRWADERGDEVAVDDGARSLTWSELEAAAGALAEKIADVERLAVLAGPTLETTISVYACAQADVVYCPVPVMFTPHELSRVFEELDAGMVYVADPFDSGLTEAGFGSDILPRVSIDWNARIRPADPADPDDLDVPCWILWTSGSTAFPKPALIPNRSPLLSGYAYAHALATSADDSCLNFFPFFHSGGLNMFLTQCLAAGCRLRLMPDGFEPGEAMRIIRDEQITRCGGFDVFWNRMRNHPDWSQADFSSLGACTMGGNLTTYDLLESLGIPLIVTAYASTEASLATVTVPDESNTEMRKMANGRPTVGTEIRIVDPLDGSQVDVGVPGEICVKGPLSFVGYDRSNEPDDVDADGFFHSGDHGWVDPDGRVWFRGRYKMMVKSGGENISCKEVEIALETLVEGVVSAQVVGVPDDDWGEIAIAFVEVEPSTEFDPASIRSTLRSTLAGFKIPKRFHKVDPGGWPLTLTGKVRRDELAALDDK